MDLKIIQARVEHLPDFARRIRLEDRLEAMAASGSPLIPALEEGIKVSEGTCWMALVDGKPAVIFGASPHPNKPEVGIIWLLGSEDILKYPLTFHKQAKRWLKVIHEKYPKVTNVADCRNVVHLQWIEKLGFRFTKMHQQYGPFGLPFVEFERDV